MPQRRRLTPPLAALALLVSMVGLMATPAAAARYTAPPTSVSPGTEGPAVAANPAAPAPPDAKAWIVVDADTGAVLAASNEHALMRPASIIKVLTALIAVSQLAPDATIPVGGDAAATEAAKINMKAGQVWTLNDTLHSLLMVSANDAAVALADRVGGSEAGFASDMNRAVKQLGITDAPVLNDPAGLDDSFAFGGGDMISAWDMAVIARDAMSLPAIRAVVALPVYNFIGPDGVAHVLHNHDKLLAWDPSVVGVKPGWTTAAGETLITESTRNGHSVIAVEMDATPAKMYAGMEYLLAQGFTAASSEYGLPHLPALRVPDLRSTPVVAINRPASPVTATVGRSRGHLSGGTVAVLLALGLGAFAVWRRRPERSRVWHAASRHPSTGWVTREPVAVGSSIFDQDDG